MWSRKRVNNLSRNISIWRTLCLCGIVEQLPLQLINSWRLGKCGLGGSWLIQYWLEQRLNMCAILSLVSLGTRVSQKGVNFLQCLMVINGRLMRLALFKRRAKWPLRKSLVWVILTIIVRCSRGYLANGRNIAMTIEGGARLTRRRSLPPTPLLQQ